MTRTIGAMFGAPDTATFLGLPAQLHGAARAAILGVPGATPYAAVGAYCAGGPAAIRAAIAGYAANIAHIDFDFGGPLFASGAVTACDLGDVAFDDADHAGTRDRIRAAVARILDAGAVPVVLGGDDSVPIPMLQAFAGREPVTIVQIDAHIDWREEVGGERWGLSSTMRRASEMAHVERIVQVGQRGIGSARPADAADARAWGVEFVSGREIAAHGVGRALALVPEGADVIVAFDCDALDPSIMPGVIGAAPGGLTYWQAVELLHGIAAKARIAGFDLVEFMPERDVAGIGALTAARLVANVLGLIDRQPAQAAA